MKRIFVKQLLGNDCLMSHELGQRLYLYVNEYLEKEVLVELDFSGIKYYSITFFNHSFGQILRDKFTLDYFNNYVKVSGFSKMEKLQFEKLLLKSCKLMRNTNEKTRYVSSNKYKSRSGTNILLSL